MLSFPTHIHCRTLTSVISERASALAERGAIRQVQAGEMVYAMGEATDHLYYVQTGRVRTSILSPDGKEYVMKLISPGELFGELCFCSVRRRQEQAVAVADSRLVRLEVAHLISLVSGSKAELTGLLEFFCHRMGDMQNQLAELAFASVRTRLGFLLLRLAEGGAAGPGGRQRCRENLTHEEIAARIATTREQVSMILAQYRKQGLVDYRRGSPILVDVSRLADFLQTSA